MPQHHIVRKLEFFLCVCGSEALAIEDPGVLEDGTIPVSIWRSARHGEGLWTRLKHIWFIIRYGHPYMDEVLLTPDQATVVAAQLAAFADKGRKIERRNADATDL